MVTWFKSHWLPCSPKDADKLYKGYDCQIQYFLTEDELLDYVTKKFLLVTEEDVKLHTYMDSIYKLYTYRRRKVDKEKILERIKNAKKELAEAEEQLKGYEKKQRWQPEEGDEYYDILTDLSVSRPITWYDDDIDRLRYARYNVFKTCNDAEVEIERILVRRELQEIAKQLNTSEANQEYYYIALHSNSLTLLSIPSGHTGFPYKVAGVVYCNNPEFLNVAKERIGAQRLMDYIRSF